MVNIVLISLKFKKSLPKLLVTGSPILCNLRISLDFIRNI